MDTGTIFGIGATIISLITLVLNRRDKAINDTKENNLGLINYRLDKLDENVQKILAKLDNYDKELEDRIEKAILGHVELYHKRRRKSQ